jgi:hypothetical protein
MTADRQPQVNIASVATGLCFVGLGILLLLQRAGMVQFEQVINLWPVVLIILGASVAWQASRGGDTSSVGAGVAGLVWLLLLGLLFSHVFDRKSRTPEGEGQINAFAVMARQEPPAVAGTFRGGLVTSMMGGVKLDLRSAQLEPGETATIDVFGVMSGTDILVPPHWTVSFETTTVMAGASDRRHSPEAEEEAAGEPAESVASDALPVPADDLSPPFSNGPPPRLIVRGVAVMSGISVK